MGQGPKYISVFIADIIQKQLSVFSKKLLNFAIFKGKHPCWSIFNKVAGLKRDSNTGVFL